MPRRVESAQLAQKSAKKWPFSLTLRSRKRDNTPLREIRPVPSFKRWIYRGISLVLILCLLEPCAAIAQPANPATTTQAPQPMPTAPGARPATQNIMMPARSVAGPDYRLGNGDVLDVQIAGRLDVTRLQVIVDPEGLVNIPPLGAIPVGGLTLLESNRRISER